MEKNRERRVSLHGQLKIPRIQPNDLSVGLLA
jgi:hypothetical protein